MENWVKRLIKKEGTIQLYLCGPTVYDDIHIGNLRPILITDILIRHLTFCTGESTNISFTQNITDIDDKIIQRASELGVSEKDLTEQYLNSFLKILLQVNCFKPTNLPKVSEEISSCVNATAKLIASQNAYHIPHHGVLFETNSVENYGQLFRENLDNQSTEEDHPQKKGRHDFFLWKITPKGVQWDSPWGKGRPGWHTECAALISKYCSNLDLHIGGIDLKFPHHQNEEVIFHSIHNRPITINWLHIGHVHYNHLKISKSDKTKLTAKTLLLEHHPDFFRYLFLSSGITKPLNLSDQLMQEKASSFKELQNALKKSSSVILLNKLTPPDLGKIDPPTSILNSLNDNLSLPNVLSFIEGVKSSLLSKIRDVSNPDPDFLQSLSDLHSSLKHLGFKEWQYLPELEEYRLLLSWQEQYENKNFQKSDEIRESLIRIGFF